DAGATWSLLNTPLGVNDVVTDPDVPSKVFVVAGTILESVDGGSTWGPSNVGFGQQCLPVRKIAISKSDPSTLFAATNGNCRIAVYRSRDGGTTWQPTNLLTLDANEPTSITVDPTNENVVYLAASVSFGTGGAVFRTLDGGNAWSHFDEGLPGLPE